LRRQFVAWLSAARQLAEEEAARARQAAEAAERARISREALAQVAADPFGPHGNRGSGEIRPNIGVDPFRTDSGAELSREGFEVATEVFASGVEALNTAIDQDIADAPEILSGERLHAYMEGAKDTRSITSGLEKALRAAPYVVDAVGIARAETDLQRGEAAGSLAQRFVVDASTEGAVLVIPRVFGPRVAAVLLGPVAWLASVGAEVLSSTPVGRDPAELILDQSGRTSVREKQEALGMLWRQYDRRGTSWTAGQRRELLDLTDLVYRQTRDGDLVFGLEQY
jgi:hypothetical protein